MNPQDPFHTAQSDIQSLFQTTRSLHASYTRILGTTAIPSKSPELLSARQDLLSSLEELSADLQDLVDSVKAVEGDPYRYGLDVQEVARRRKFVQDVAGEIEGLRGEVGRPLGQDDTTRGGSGGASGNGKAPATASGLPDPEAFDSDAEDGEGDNYEQFERERQQELIQEQDVQLDGVFRTVGNLRQQADEMGRELEEQGELLDSVDTLTDRVGGKIQTGVKRIGWVIRNNEDRCSSCCIGVLIAVLILLLLLVLIL